MQPQRQHVGVRRQDAQVRVRHLPAHQHSKAQGRHCQAYEHAFHIAAMAQQEDVPEGAGEAETAALQGESKSQPQAPEESHIRVEPAGYQQDDTRSSHRAQP